MIAHPAISRAVAAHVEAVTRFFEQQEQGVVALADTIASALANGKKILICGNGGSACDALHFSGEFVGRFIRNRKALPVIALTADGGALTAIGNDYGFDQIFSRQVEAFGVKGDVLIAISTSGSSANVLAALSAARQAGLHTALLTGQKAAAKKDLADILLAVPTEETARIQEVHITALQIVVGLVEAKLFPELAAGAA